MMNDKYNRSVSAAEYLAQPGTAPSELPNDELSKAIKIKWRGEHPDYWSEIYGRYRKMPIDDAIRCVSAGYSSPAHAMTEGFVKRPP
jgi:hypothetical protein